MTDLVLGAGFSINPNIATRRVVLLGQPEVGKTNGMTVIGEELLKIGVPITVLDWKGDLWGLRSSADGTRDGFPVVIFGGDHADVAIDEGDGKEIGHLVATENMPSLIDLSLFHADTSRRRFATAFLKAFLHGKRNATSPHTLLIDEFQQFAPQHPRGESAALLGATEAVCGLGRKRGIGVIGTALRAAQLNKNVVELSDVYLFMQIAGKNDLASIGETIQSVASAEEKKTILSTIPRLGKGEVVVYSPAWMRVLEERRFRLRETFDSSRTPEVGVEVGALEPASFAPIDAPALAARIAATRESREAEDPAALRKQIAALKSQISKPDTTDPDVLDAMQRRAESAEHDWQFALHERDQARRQRDANVSIVGSLESVLRLVQTSAAAALDGLKLEAERINNEAAPDLPAQGASPDARSAVATPSARATNAHDAGRDRPDVTTLPRLQDMTVGGGERKMLAALADTPNASATRVQLGMLSGFAHGGGTFQKYLSNLKRLGHINVEGSLVTISASGSSIAGARRRSTSAEIVEQWIRTTGGGPGKMLRVLADFYPRAISRAQIGERTGYAHDGGTFQKYFSQLRSAGLIEVRGADVRAAHELFPTGALKGGA